ncbi:ribosome biogenesis GTPase Der [Candidatus Dependentiae bacterium]
MSKLSKVVIVGRVNVGKSTLFNRLSTQVKSITFDYPGVTRDFITDEVCWQNKCFELIDTGGVSLRKTKDPILEEVRQRALELVKEADLVIFVCDGKIGVVQEDAEISKLLHKIGKKVFLVINKIDSQKAEENQYQFDQLGHKDLFALSAQHGRSISPLLDAIADSIPKEKVVQDEQQEDVCKVVLLGKPNVGKSSLLNALLQQERAIVSEVPGTTREPIKEKIKFYKGDIQITDTAGVRRKRAVEEDLEKFMVKTSFKALKDANVVLLLVDASEGRLSDQELKLAFYAFDNYKALIILFNKQDLVTEEIQEKLKFNLEPYKYLIKKIETMNISCKSGKNVGKVLTKIDKVWERYSQRFSNDELTLFFKEALYRKPLYHKTMMLAVRAVKQIGTAPIALLVIANVPEWFGSSQLGYFDNLLRKKYDLKGVPIKFIVRKKG